MPKFTAHVHLYDETGVLVSFAPGDIAPAWVKPLAGAHVLDKPFSSNSPSNRNRQPAAKADLKKPEPKGKEESGTSEKENDEEAGKESEDAGNSEGSDAEGDELSFTSEESDEESKSQ